MIVPQNQRLTYVELWIQATTKRVFISWTGLRLLSNKYIYVVHGHCIPCGGANLQQGPTTVKHDT